MEKIPPPKHAGDYPDRPLDCEEAMALAFRILVRRALVAGWTEIEVALALADVADDHVLALARKARGNSPILN